MVFEKEIKRLLLGMILLFALVALTATYWGIPASNQILGRDDNPRLVEEEESILRGAIFDRNGELLVESTVIDEIVTRQYMHSEMNSALGYYSIRYGVGSAESAFNTLLRGDDLQDSNQAYFNKTFLHLPQEGSDIRLTFDLTTQQELVRKMENLQGSAVVMAVPTGEVLAMVSLPTYNPNTLDAEWDTLTSAEGNPFFNRALQGSYQPGATFQTLLLASAIANGNPLDTEFTNRIQSVRVDDLETTCTFTPPDTALNFAEAYAYACPFPFVQLAESLGASIVQNIENRFNLNRLPTLTNYLPLEDPNSEEPTPISPSTLIETALGQGNLVINPMEMATLVASIVNRGNAPQPYTILQKQLPESNTWEIIPSSTASVAVMTEQIAQELEALMAENMLILADETNSEEIRIGGHVALAYAGDETQTWFTGFLLSTQTNQKIVIALVLEDTDNPDLALEIGLSGLLTAYQTFN